MFEDLIPPDEDFMTTALRHSEDIFNLQPLVTSTLEHTFSKDSDAFRYNYGRLNGKVPERFSYFSLVYPRRATNLDTDYHHLTSDADTLSRWISHDVLKFLVPILYFQDMQWERMEKRATALTAKPVPTTQELKFCSKLKGAGYWNRKGIWFCTTKNVSSLHDEFGPTCFAAYSEWVAWENKIAFRIDEARNANDDGMVHKLRQARYVRWNE